jgi:hypothetical protein
VSFRVLAVWRARLPAIVSVSVSVIVIVLSRLSKKSALPRAISVGFGAAAVTRAPVGAWYQATTRVPLTGGVKVNV